MDYVPNGISNQTAFLQLAYLYRQHIKGDMKCAVPLRGGGGGVTPIRCTCSCPSYGSICGILPGLWVMFCEFCPCLGYASALWRFAAVIDTCLCFFINDNLKLNK